MSRLPGRVVTAGAVIVAVLTGAPVAVAQTRAAGAVSATLLDRAEVQRALEAVRVAEPLTIDEQIRLCEIPAPPFGERARATAYAAAFREVGLEGVRIDEAGNVIGERPGRAARPHLVLSAHLDTVFPPGTDVRVTREGSQLRGPGIGDDCRGLAVLLGVARALKAGGVVTQGRVTFLGTVGEEGLGDLRGVKAFFAHTGASEVDRFVSIDGGGVGITSGAVGSRRYRVTFSGPGGHSFGNFGMANPVHALGRLIGVVAGFVVADEPRTTFNVGRIGGGTSVNSIAEEAWLEVDLRSTDAGALSRLEARFLGAVEAARRAEQEHWSGRGGLRVEAELVGDRPAGAMPNQSPIVQAVSVVTRALELPVRLDAGSTDANQAMSLGVPALTIGGGGLAVGPHTLDESFDTTDSWRGTARALLVAIALTEP